ncbi:Ku protein [Patulibacter sp.]|uniref:non-homologous end joining protein Ku n=1 Tax=Patulibacter sp. TaxID=1912859 RepID=UPI00272278AB|nr:Ku protein [Patulibacter sp.]MDO9409074.1 Ku protein [Patulibacter sp.]
MARSLWTGSLSFGLVNVPVQLVSAVRDQDVRFHQVHKDTGERVQTMRVASTDGEEVAWEDIAKGWETDDGEMVVLTDEDFEAAQPEKTRTVDIDLFVDLQDIDPVYFDHPYWLLPAGDGAGPVRAYRLLVDVMGSAGQVAIGRIVLRAKEYLVALREQDGLLSLTTMRFADELRSPDEIDAIPQGATGRPSRREVDDAVALIGELTDEFRPARYDDCHRVRLLKLIDEKRRSGKVQIPEPEPEPVAQKAPKDLMAALEESLAKARGGKGSGGTGSGGSGTSKRKRSAKSTA